MSLVESNTTTPEYHPGDNDILKIVINAYLGFWLFQINPSICVLSSSSSECRLASRVDEVCFVVWKIANVRIHDHGGSWLLLVILT